MTMGQDDSVKVSWVRLTWYDDGAMSVSKEDIQVKDLKEPQKMTIPCTPSQAGTKSGQGIMVKLVKRICHCNIFTCTVHVNKHVKRVNLDELILSAGPAIPHAANGEGSCYAPGWAQDSLT